MIATVPGDENGLVICNADDLPDSPYTGATEGSTGHVSYGLEAASAGPNSGLLYIDKYGWFDKQHWDVGDPKGVIQQVKDAVQQGGGQVSIQHGVKYGFQIRVTYWVSGDVPAALIHAVALGLYLDFGYRFEAWEGITPIIGWNTSFSVEDQPTHYLSMAAAILGLSQCEMMSLLGPVKATAYEPPSSIFPGSSIKNHGITPRIQNANGNWLDVPWPSSVQLDVTSADSRYWRPLYWQMDVVPGRVQVWLPPAFPMRAR
jgi:hypothetical protein